MLEISNYFNIKWPKEYKEISVGIGLIPVCPRYIKEKAFDIHKKNKEDLIDTCMHELCHFLFFEKCKEIYPNWKYEDFDSPSLLWYLSEIIIDPTLNSDNIQKIYKHKFKCYDIFYNVEIDNIKSFIIPGGDIKTICNEEVYELIRDLVKKEIIVAAICAGVDVLENTGVLKDTKSTHSEDTDIYNDKKVITARANAYVDFAIEAAKELQLFESETDLQETIDFWKYHKRM